MKRMIFLAVIIFTALFSVISCGGSDSKNDEENDDLLNDDDSISKNENPLRFNLKNIDMIISAKSPIDVHGLKSITKLPETFSTNVVGVSMEGEIQPLIETDYNMIDIDLAMTDPQGKYLYVVINGPQELIDDLDQCRFLRAPVENEGNFNKYECISPYWKPVFAYGNYGERLAGDRKPLHFDSFGNLFFLATGPGGTALLKLDTVDVEIPENYPLDLISPLGKLVRITDSAQMPVDFLLTPTGVPVWAGSTQSGSGWFLKAGLPEGGEVTFASSQVKFYATDTHDAILWASAEGDDCRGIRFARLSKDGGFKKRCFDTKRFSPSAWMGNPEHLMLANDGFYYALFENTGRITLSRVFPPNPEPIMGVEFKGNWHYELPPYIAQGNFQISHQHVFAITEIDDPNYGIKNVIRAVRVDNREEKLLFNSKRVEIYRFKISGDKMFVVGRDLNKMASFVAEVDMAGLVKGEAEDTIIKEAETYNAALDSENIQDMTIVRPAVPEKPTGVNPKLMDVLFDIDEPQIATLSFSVPVDESSVETSMTLNDSEKKSVETFGVWGYANLHLLTGDSKTADGIGGELEWGKTYDFKLGDKAFDKWDNPISDKTEKFISRDAFKFSIRPADIQPFEFPATLRFVLDPDLYEEWGTTEKIESFWFGKFDESIADTVEGVEIITEFRAFLPQLTVSTYPFSAGFAFQLKFYNWEECYEEYPPADCHNFEFCIPTETALKLGSNGRSTTVGSESQTKGCDSDLTNMEDNSWQQLNFRKIRAKRFGTFSNIEEIFEDESVVELHKVENATDTAFKRENPVMVISAGSTIEFRMIEIWPLDHDGN
ncbi:MAG TPA: hypothetical protein VLJ60_09855, partial [bacterium]|nr:hypothetical protein [bacterium]